MAAFVHLGLECGRGPSGADFLVWSRRAEKLREGRVLREGSGWGWGELWMSFQALKRGVEIEGRPKPLRDTPSPLLPSQPSCEHDMADEHLQKERERKGRREGRLQ